MKVMLWGMLTWLRRCLAAIVVGGVTFLSLMDTTGMQAHEMAHVLAHFYRYTGIEADKVVHFVMYFGVCGALWIGFPLRFWGRPSALWAFLFAFGWGILMEVCQWAGALFGMGARSLDLRDIFANGCGAFTAMLICLVLMCVMERWGCFRRLGVKEKEKLRV